MKDDVVKKLRSAEASRAPMTGSAVGVQSRRFDPWSDSVDMAAPRIDPAVTAKGPVATAALVGRLQALLREHFEAAFSDHEPARLQLMLDAVDTALARGAPNGDAIGTVIMEPIQGRGGARVPAPGFLAGVAARARAAGALVVHDEVLTGFGRTGRLFAHEHEGVVPDVLCVGKALGGGMPISACLAPRSVMDAWPESKGEAIHTTTFLGHPVGCAAALAFLDVLAEENLVGRAAKIGEVLATGLRRGLEGVRGVVDVRGRGLLVGVELEGAQAAALVAERGLRLGLLLIPAGERAEVLELTPPAVLTEDQLDHAIDAVTETIRRWALET